MRIFFEIDFVIELQNGDVVIKGTGVEFWMHVNTDDITFDVWEEFNVMIDVPFAEACTQVTACVSLDTMGSCHYVSRRDESTTANVDTLRWVLFQNGHLPWILACDDGRG